MAGERRIVMHPQTIQQQSKLEREGAHEKETHKLQHKDNYFHVLFEALLAVHDVSRNLAHVVMLERRQAVNSGRKTTFQIYMAYCMTFCLCTLTCTNPVVFYGVASSIYIKQRLLCV